MFENPSNPARGDNLIRVEIITSSEQLLHAYAIRAICFMEEHGVAARQTYDGNDYQATHIIVYADNEPIGTARIRWFRDFAKMERVSFRQAWRNPRTVKRCAEFIFEHIARKGYDRVLAHARPKYARLWRGMLGFRAAPSKKPLVFSGHDEPYMELIKDLVPPHNAISLETDPSILFRVEGFWDERSEFEAIPL